MFITGLGTATPRQRYTQGQCWDAFQAAPQFAQLDRGARTTLQKVLLHDNGISTRALAFDALAEVFAAEPETLQRRFAPCMCRCWPPRRQLRIASGRIAGARDPCRYHQHLHWLSVPRP
jgi:hypothetical protein